MIARTDNLPRGWIRGTLADLVKPRGEKVSPLEFPDYEFIGMDHVERDTNRIIGSTPASTMKSSAARFYAGDVLYGRLRPYLNKVTQPWFDGLASAEFIVISGNELVNAGFLKYRLSARDFVSFSSHLNEGDRPRVSFDQIGKFELLVPPPSEQERIVARIDELFSELDRGVESLRRAKEQLKVYRQAVLIHAFQGKFTSDWREKEKGKFETGDQLMDRVRQEREVRYSLDLEEWKAAVDDWERMGKPGKKPVKPRSPQAIETSDLPFEPLPSGWVWQCLGNLNVDVFDGPFGSNLKTSDYVDEGVRVIRLENIGYLEFVEEKHSYVTEEKYETIKKHTVHKGDLVFSSFVTDGIRVAILPGHIDRAVNKADCFCIRLHGETVRGDYLAHFLTTRSAYKQIESEIHGVGRPRINTSQLKCFAIPLCSPHEQNEVMAEIADKLSLADHIGSALEDELRRCEKLRESILARAFSGQLVEQNANDEPVSALLERIGAEDAAQDTVGSKRAKKKKSKDAA